MILKLHFSLIKFLKSVSSRKQREQNQIIIYCLWYMKHKQSRGSQCFRWWGKRDANRSWQGQCGLDHLYEVKTLKKKDFHFFHFFFSTLTCVDPSKGSCTFRMMYQSYSTNKSTYHTWKTCLFGKIKMIFEVNVKGKGLTKAWRWILSKHMCVPTHARRNKVRYFVSSEIKMIMTQCCTDFSRILFQSSDHSTSHDTTWY
jgi:hypothetical protein